MSATKRQSLIKVTAPKKELDELPGFSKLLIKMLSEDFKKEIKKNKAGSVSK